ncbi:flp operon protein C [Pasteurella skyensis]|uniref:Flp operon protein C n=1 Tax=Phocoenobacter skyensis TaxID=97481 RepID=A0AAJ6NDT4_9PAST|nr:flp operon protein C [Pasteurella skyensis]MDP8170821.1 flp operon protein C [Pasteurella skyensis]MDP8174927.1 flp operon protein C [Pasteurella skyensis]
MNYRVLFIISFLILGIGFAGLFLSTDETKTTSTETTQAPTQTQNVKSQKKETPKIKTVVITVAVVKKDLIKGHLLQESDYQISNVPLKIPEGGDDPLLAYDLKPIFREADVNSLQGFLLQQNVAKNSILNPVNVLSPHSPDFLMSSLEPSQEVAYQVSIQQADSYLLQTLKGGNYVSIYSFQDGQGKANQYRNDLVKIVDNLLVLQTISLKGDEERKSKKQKPTDVVGFIALKMTAEQVKVLYSLPKGARLILLPVAKPTPTKARGTFIRKLRG